MTEARPSVAVTDEETLPEVIARLRDAARSGSTVDLVVPIDSSLLLTASEFRLLKEAIDEDRLPVVLRTSDPLRLRLGERLGLLVRPMPRPTAKAMVAPPAPALPASPDLAEVQDDAETVPAIDVEPSTRPDPMLDWPNLNGASPEVASDEGDAPGNKGEVATGPSNPPRRWLPVAALLVALVVAAFLAIRFVVPRAVVRLVPQTAPVTASLVFDVTADGKPLDDHAAFALAPAGRELEVVWEGSIPVSGVRLEPDGIAEGPIELRNAADEPLTVDASTTVETETGEEFSFVESVTVPPWDPATGEPGAATAKVRAMSAGSGGNVGTGELGGRLENGVYYSNRMQPTQGGTDKEFPVVAQVDLDALAAQAKEAAPDLAATAIAERDQGDGVLLSTVSVAKQSDEFDHQPNEDAETVALRSTMTLEVETYDKAAAEKQVRQALAALLASAAPAGFAVDPQRIEFDAPVAVKDIEGGTRLEVTARTDARARIDEHDLRVMAAELAGKSSEEAAAVISRSQSVAEFSVEYQPGWLPQEMPSNPDRIAFELTE